MNVYDHYYERVENGQLSKAQLMDILNQLSRLNSFGNNKKNPFDLYLRMSEEPVVDDELIKALIEANLGYGGFNNGSYKIVDNGSKAVFDDLWKNGIGNYKTLKFWKSKHTDAKQLEQIYNEYFAKTVKIDPNHKTWLEQERKDFMKHPNVSDKIVGRVSFTKKPEDLASLAANPKITDKPKAFEAVCNMAKGYGYDVKKDAILRNLLNNKGLDWKTVAKGIDIVSNVKHIFSTGAFVSAEKTKLIIDFCRHPDCPEQIKAFIYEKIKDEAFLPQAAKDIFLF